MKEPLPGKKFYLVLLTLAGYKVYEYTQGALTLPQLVDLAFGGGLLAAARAAVAKI